MQTNGPYNQHLAAIVMGCTLREFRKIEDGGLVPSVVEGTRRLYKHDDLQGVVGRARAGRTKPGPAWPAGTFTYFFRAGDDGPIKIGLTDHLARRFHTFKHSLWLKARCLGVIAGNREEAIHVAFSAFRIRGEWFRPEPTLLAFIEAETIDPLEPEAES